MVTVFDSQDLSFALQTSRVLKLQIFMNDLNESKDQSKSMSIEEFKKQLRDIRNAVTQMLDSIDNPQEGKNSNIVPTRKIIFTSFFKKYNIFCKCHIMTFSQVKKLCMLIGHHNFFDTTLKFICWLHIINKKCCVFLNDSDYLFPWEF